MLKRSDIWALRVLNSYIGHHLGALPLWYNKIPYCHTLAETLGKFENEISRKRCVWGRKRVKAPTFPSEFKTADKIQNGRQNLKFWTRSKNWQICKKCCLRWPVIEATFAERIFLCSEMVT